MKRLALILLFTLFAMSGYAQTIKLNAPDVEIKFKRCIASGGSAYVDLVMTNWSGKEFSGLLTHQEQMASASYDNYYTAVYDDEGNMYRHNSLSFSFAGESSYSFYAPCEIPIKVRLYIRNLDEYASEIKLLKMAFRGMPSAEPYGAALLEIRDIPITRQ